MRNNRALFLLVFALALLVRVAWLDKFPPGLWFDEGLKGVDAWHTLHGGGFLLIYPDVFPREPLFVWLLSVPLKVFGPRVIVMRLTVALLGSLACAMFFLMVGSTERRRGAVFALTAAFVLATLHWHAHFSRLIFRTNLVPLVSVILVFAMAGASRVGERRRWLAWLGAGAVAGVGHYTYLSWWFFLPVILVWFWAFQIPEDQYECARNRSRYRHRNRNRAPYSDAESDSDSDSGSDFEFDAAGDRRNLRAADKAAEACTPNTNEPPSPHLLGVQASDAPEPPPLRVQASAARNFAANLAWFVLGAITVGSPLAIHYARFPQDLFGRPEAISPFHDGLLAGLRTVSHNLGFVLSMFSYKGDHVPKHNVPWTPVLDVVWSIFFYGGILRAIQEAGRRTAEGRRACAWLAWMFFMSLPSVFSKTDSANTLRNLGATPAVAFFVASGWWWAYAKVGEVSRLLLAPKANGASPRFPPTLCNPSFFRLILMAGLLWGAGFQVYKEWVRHPRAKDMANSFSVLHVELARLTTPDPHGALVFVPTDFFVHKTFEFLTIGRTDLRPLDPVALLSKDPGKAVDHRVICTMLSTNHEKLIKLFPDSSIEEAKLFMGGDVFAWILRIPAGALFPPRKPPKKRENST